jgi:inhibitor of cysteine peptidase
MMRTLFKLLPIAGLLAIMALALDLGSPREILLTAADSGSVVEVREDQVLAISLESNPSTGFSWEITQVDEAILQQVGGVEFESHTTLPGAPGTQTLRFKALKTGKSALELVYRRSWEEGTEPQARFSAQVIIP